MIVRFNGVDLDKLVALSKDIETISDGVITFKANEYIQFKVGNNNHKFIYSMGPDGNFLIFESCISMENVRFSTRGSAVKSTPPKC